MPGLRVPQGSVGALEQEQPSWIVGREVMETRRDTGSSGPQQIVLPENTEDEEDLKEIPANLSERERLMLQMTQAEEERGAVRVIKCKLCPKARLSSWVIFERHCRSCEKHPSDSGSAQIAAITSHVQTRENVTRIKRHQEACHKTSQDEAKKKRENVERIFYAFDAALTFCLKNGLEIGPRFSDVVAPRHSRTLRKKYPRRRRSCGKATLGPPDCYSNAMYTFFFSFSLWPAYRVRLRCSTTDDICTIFLFLPVSVLLYIFCRVDILTCVFRSALD
jgi:hypothetical protein